VPTRRSSDLLAPPHEAGHAVAVALDERAQGTDDRGGFADPEAEHARTDNRQIGARQHAFSGEQRIGEQRRAVRQPHAVKACGSGGLSDSLWAGLAPRTRDVQQHLRPRVRPSHSRPATNSRTGVAVSTSADVKAAVATVSAKAPGYPTMPARWTWAASQPAAAVCPAAVAALCPLAVSSVRAWVAGSAVPLKGAGPTCSRVPARSTSAGRSSSGMPLSTPAHTAVVTTSAVTGATASNPVDT